MYKSWHQNLTLSKNYCLTNLCNFESSIAGFHVIFSTFLKVYWTIFSDEKCTVRIPKEKLSNPLIQTCQVCLSSQICVSKKNHVRTRLIKLGHTLIMLGLSLMMLGPGVYESTFCARQQNKKLCPPPAFSTLCPPSLKTPFLKKYWYLF